MTRLTVLALLLSAACFGQDLASDRVVGSLEVVASFNGAMPTGVTVANDGRIFVNFPRWGDDVLYTVAEIKNGKTVAYPDAAINQYAEGGDANDRLVSVQSVVVDPSGKRLWIVDTGSIAFGPVKPGGAKLIAVDLSTNQVVKKIVFPESVVFSTSYVNDVRFDLHRGKEGVAYLTDSTSTGPNGIIVVDLASGKSWRRLNDHPSTKSDPQFVPVIEGQIFKMRLPGQAPTRFAVGADGIALSADGILDKNAKVGGVVLMLSALGAVWAAVNASLGMIAGLNRAYETQEDRGWPRVFLLAAALAIAVIGLLFGTLVALQYAATAFGAASGASRMAVQWIAVVCVLTTSLALFYRFAPNLRVHTWMWSLPGAGTGALLWAAATVVMRAYFNEFSSYHRIYGRVAPAAMLLLWLYLTSAAVLIGAELNSEIDKAREPAGAGRRPRSNPAGGARRQS